MNRPLKSHGLPRPPPSHLCPHTGVRGCSSSGRCIDACYGMQHRVHIHPLLRAMLHRIMLTIQAIGGVPATPSCVLVGKFGKNKFIPWHANLGVIAGKDHSHAHTTIPIPVDCGKRCLVREFCLRNLTALVGIDLETCSWSKSRAWVAITDWRGGAGR
jgi:hypothetical protein